MSYTHSYLGRLKHLISIVENAHTRRELENWVEENIIEFGMCIEVSRYELENIREDKESFLKYKKKAIAHEIGQKMIDVCGSEEVYDTPYGERTNYRIFGIKHRK